MSTLEKYKQKLEEKKEKIKKIADVAQEDENMDRIQQIIDYMVETMKEKKQLSPDALSDLASKLSVRYAKLAFDLGYQRTLRDAAEMSIEELEGQLVMENREKKDTVTEAKAMTKQQISEAKGEMLGVRSQYRVYRDMESATSKVLSILQSVIKTKLQDKVTSNMQKN